MYITNNLETNDAGHLTIAGMDAVALAKQYGTPLYVMDEGMIRDNMKQFRDSVKRYYHGKGFVCYASKAFSCKEIYRIAMEESIGVDVVSAGELHTAASVGFPPEKICYHGNNKTESELRMAIDYGVGYLVVDNLDELELAEQVAGGLGKTVRILLRVTPGVEAHTHEFIQTGQIDSKFGLAIELGLAMQGVQKALTLPHLQLEGIHCHIGSQIFEIEPFAHAADILLGFMAQVKQDCGYEMKTMNLGGGFGIAYTGGDDPVAYDDYMKQVSETVKHTAEKLGIALPFVIIEPGRAVVGPAGMTLYTVGGVKEIPDIRKYVSVDGGMTDNIRYALYQAEYDFIVANRADLPKSEKVTIAGRCCESGDLLGEHVALQPAQIGDILAVCATGAYNYSMANHYNRVPKPAVVMVKGNESRVVVRRETLDDIISCDI